MKDETQPLILRSLCVEGMEWGQKRVEIQVIPKQWGKGMEEPPRPSQTSEWPGLRPSDRAESSLPAETV